MDLDDSNLLPIQTLSYWEFNTEGEDYGEQRPWIEWFKAHGFARYSQIPTIGWAARDVKRKTVSVLAFDFDEDSVESQFHTDRHDNGVDPRYRVWTIQLDHEPLPFPVTRDQP